jgi:ubiquinone/menaquinone biosynthesis C-methylase UbiE
MKSWVVQQTEFALTRFDDSLETHYRESSHYFKIPKDFYHGIMQLWNYLDAVKMVDWNRYLKPNAHVLDLAGGTGWLCAYLSTFDRIEKIYNVDSSRYFLSVMMPEIIRLMNGNAEKIEPIEGIFSPLLFDDGSLDVVVISSSLHHADSLELILKEIHRVLKKEGLLFILNETPFTNTRYVLSMIKQFIVMMKNTMLHKYKSTSQHISSSGFLYDPALGDRAYPFWYWEKAIISAGFPVFNTIDTKLVTIKAQKKGINLVHFVCKKVKDAEL